MRKQGPSVGSEGGQLSPRMASHPAPANMVHPVGGETLGKDGSRKPGRPGQEALCLLTPSWEREGRTVLMLVGG